MVVTLISMALLAALPTVIAAVCSGTPPSLAADGEITVVIGRLLPTVEF
jgi:hypothetical protein